jgi:AmmeMemoRadiSam system protein A
MDRSPLDEFPVSPREAELLLDIVEVSIRACLDGTNYPGPDTTKLPETLCRPCGAFVTLHVAGQLNGCIGNIEPGGQLGVCVSELARRAAFHDPRLPTLTRADLDRLHIEIALLSARTPIPAETRDELIAHLEPRLHGLIISTTAHRAVFLPTVWNQLRTPDQFVDGLLRKAGLSTRRWPSDLTAEVLTTTSFGRHIGGPVCERCHTA